MSAPSWLNEDNANLAGKVAANPTAQAIAKKKAQEQLDAEAGFGRSSQAAGPSDIDLNDQLVTMDPESYAKMKKYSFYLACMYLACAILMATAAVLSLNKDGSTAFIALYVFSFAVMIFCFDFAPFMGFSKLSNIVANNCGFMYSGGGRLSFLIFVAVLCYHLLLLGQIVMGLLLAATIFHMYVIFSFPSFSAFLRRKHLLGKE